MAHGALDCYRFHNQKDLDLGGKESNDSCMLDPSSSRSYNDFFLNPQFSSLLNGVKSDTNLRGLIVWVDWKVIFYLLKEGAK